MKKGKVFGLILVSVIMLLLVNGIEAGHNQGVDTCGNIGGSHCCANGCADSDDSLGSSCDCNYCCTGACKESVGDGGESGDCCDFTSYYGGCSNTDSNVQVLPNCNQGREFCNGLDDNCNGFIDEGCDKDGDGYANAFKFCPLTTRFLDNSAFLVNRPRVPRLCNFYRGDCNDVNVAIRPGATETCNGLDDDCNVNTADGSSESWYGTATSCGVGACAKTGSYYCSSGTKTDSCVAGTPITETCNNKDDDCNGVVDGITSTSGCTQTGACSGAYQTCTAGAWGACSKVATTETCNSLDDDCDGSTDEGDVCLANTWANMNNEVITSANSGDTVLMKVAGTASSLSGKTVNYTAYQSVPLWFDSRVAQSSTQGYAPFTIPSTGTPFYFITAVSGVSGTQTSGNLAISGSSDSSPSASITSPSEGYNASVNFPVNFSASISDADDLLKLTWNFGDGTANYVLNNYSTFLGSNASINHSYTVPGIYDVTLTVSEMTRTNSISVSKEVRVFGSGINVVPVISEPANGVSIGDNRLVNFSAALSFVANCSNGTMVNKNFTAGNLNCSYIHAPNARTYSSNNYNITMNWTMTTEGSSEIINVYGDFVSNYNSVVVFQKDLEIRGVHTANLDMKYDSR